MAAVRAAAQERIANALGANQRITAARSGYASDRESGVVDRFPPLGVESDDDIQVRKTLLRDIGYKG